MTLRSSGPLQIQAQHGLLARVVLRWVKVFVGGFRQRGTLFSIFFFFGGGGGGGGEGLRFIGVPLFLEIPFGSLSKRQRSHQIRSLEHCNTILNLSDFENSDKHASLVRPKNPRTTQQQPLHSAKRGSRCTRCFFDGLLCTSGATLSIFAGGGRCGPVLGAP